MCIIHYFLACRKDERTDYTGERLARAWAREVATAGPNASLTAAFVSAWKFQYILPVTWAFLWILFGCTSSAVLMRTILVWFQDQGGHSPAFIVGIVIAMMGSEICKVWHAILPHRHAVARVSRCHFLGRKELR